jgi:Outer membrane lipoprotein-sorting protein
VRLGTFIAILPLFFAAPTLRTTRAEGVALPDGLAIMERAHARDLGDRMLARVHMTIRGSGPVRERSMVVRARRFSGGIARLIRFESPADVRSTGLLTRDYDAGELSDEQWLYLPGLRSSTRIATARRSGSFVGSDFSYADLTRPDPARYRHRTLAAERVDGFDCWVVESVPLADATISETGYTRLESWITRDGAFPLRIKATMVGGRVKYLAAQGLRPVKGVLTPRALVARVVAQGKVESETVLEQPEVDYDVPSVGEDDFRVEQLERAP